MTHKRLFSGVRKPMSFEMADMVVSFVAQIACVNSIIGVRPFVLNHATCLAKRLPTNLAGIWFQIHVNMHMLVQAASKREALLTGATKVWLFVGVRSSMSSQIIGLVERFWTKVTKIWFIPRMDTGMRFKVTEISEAFLTHKACVKFRSCVCPSVLG